jgi:hypothetical protein
MQRFACGTDSTSPPLGQSSMRTRTALAAAGGNTRRAAKLLGDSAAADPALARELVASFHNRQPYRATFKAK